MNSNYYKILRKTLLQFLDIFNNIKIEKYNNQGEPIDVVEVPLKFAPKQKWYYWLNAHRHEKRFPMMAAEITGIQYDEQRKTGKHEKIKIKENKDSTDYYVTPAPYNVSFELKVATHYLVEMEQIASQILPHFDPYVYTTIDLPELNDQWNIHILLENVGLDLETDIAEDENRKILWTFEFTAKTWMIKPKLETSRIKEIIQKVYLSDEAWEYQGNTETEKVSGIGHDAVEYYTKGEKTDDGKLLVSYEVFE